MGRYLARRLVGVVALLAAVLVVTFALFFAIGSNPALKSCGRTCSPARLKLIEQKLGTDKPEVTQFGLYVKGIFVGRDFAAGDDVSHCPAPCLGFSFKTDQPVTQLIEQNVPVTFSIAIGAAVLWLLFGIVTGVLSALNVGTTTDKSLVALSGIALSFPVQLIGLLLLYLVCSKGGIAFPSYVPITQDPLHWAINLILPWISLAFIYSGVYTRLTRTQMVESMQEDFIRTARGKGLPERRVAYRHGLRAAIPPLIVVFGLDIGALLGGSFVVEKIFGMPGLGTLFINAVSDLDLPILVGVTLFGAVLILVANLVVDVVYGLTDPKVTLS